jgi:hypothetical protein
MKQPSRRYGAYLQVGMRVKIDSFVDPEGNFDGLVGTIISFTEHVMPKVVVDWDDIGLVTMKADHLRRFLNRRNK